MVLACSSNFNTILQFDRSKEFGLNGKQLILHPKSPPPSSFSRSISWICGSNHSSPSPIDLAIARTCNERFNEITKNYSNLKSAELERTQIGQALNKLTLLDRQVLPENLQAKLHELVESPETLEARLAIENGHAPKPLNQTSSGTYVVPNRRGEDWAIFKPQEQELGGPQNPSWMLWLLDINTDPLKIPKGTCYLRERAAYLLDAGGFANVPATFITELAHKKFDVSFWGKPVKPLKGSFQLFISNCKPAHDAFQSEWFIPPTLKKEQGTSAVYHQFSKIQRYISWIFCDMLKREWLVPPETNRCIVWLVRAIHWIRNFFYPRIDAQTIHKMGIFDIRVLNSDRHFGNFLIDDQKRIVPIDHGQILPGTAAYIRFEWMRTLQAREPFNPATLAYIEQLDPERDAKVLNEVGILEEDSIERMKLSTRLLQACAKRGLTLFQIGDLMSRKVANTNISYFEASLCRKVLKEKQDANLIIQKTIDDYLHSN